MLLALQPCNIIPEWRGRFPARLFTASQRFVTTKDFSPKNGQRPDVRYYMMESPAELITILRQAKQRQPHKGRLGNLKATLLVYPEKIFQSVLLFNRGKVAPVRVLKSKARIPFNHLDRLS